MMHEGIEVNVVGLSDTAFTSKIINCYLIN